MPAIKIKRLHHVQICIPVGFETEARRFYTDTLGFTEIKVPSAHKLGGVWYKVGDAELHLGIEPEIYPTKRFPAFEVESIKDAVALLESKGISVKQEPEIPGMKRISFLDPWKNKLELLERI
jgi:catechol 2,3-dioxygenase-like lactoylglutathione lyase family enzyme